MLQGYRLIVPSWTRCQWDTCREEDLGVSKRLLMEDGSGKRRLPQEVKPENGPLPLWHVEKRR
jgi:hypothetical protein